MLMQQEYFSHFAGKKIFLYFYSTTSWICKLDHLCGKKFTKSCEFLLKLFSIAVVFTINVYFKTFCLQIFWWYFLMFVPETEKVWNYFSISTICWQSAEFSDFAIFATFHYQVLLQPSVKKIARTVFSKLLIFPANLQTTRNLFARKIINNFWFLLVAGPEKD